MEQQIIASSANSQRAKEENNKIIRNIIAIKLTME